MMHICMYHDVWTSNVLSGENKSRSCWGIELNASLPPGMVNEDDCENKLVGEKNSVGE